MTMIELDWTKYPNFFELWRAELGCHALDIPCIDGKIANINYEETVLIHKRTAYRRFIRKVFRPPGVHSGNSRRSFFQKGLR